MFLSGLYVDSDSKILVIGSESFVLYGTCGAKVLPVFQCLRTCRILQAGINIKGFQT